MAGPRSAPRARQGRRRDALRGAPSYAELLGLARLAAAQLGRAWSAPGRARRDRPPAGPGLRRRHSTAACCWGRSPCPSTSASPRPSRSGSPQGALDPDRGAARHRGPERPRRARSARPRRDGDDRAHLRDHLGAPAGRAELRQHPLERSRLGRRARRRSRVSAGSARCPCHTSAACRSCCARRSTRPRRSSTSDSRRTGSSMRSQNGGVTLVSLVATTLATAARCGPAAPAGAALRPDGRRPGPGGARRARARGRRPGQPHLRPHGDLLAGHDHAGRRTRRVRPRARGRRCSARGSGWPRTERSSSPARPSPRRPH